MLVLFLYAHVDTLNIDTGEDLPIRYAGEFNIVPLGCRTVSMGGAGVVLPYSDLACFWNPSLITLQNNYQTHVEGAKLYGNMASVGAISLVAPIQKGLNAALSYSAFFPGAVTQWDSLPFGYEEMKYIYPTDGYQSAGWFTNNKHRITATVAKVFNVPIPRPSNYSLPLPVDFGFGLNIKYLWETMNPSDKVRMGYNINVDFGMVVRIGVDYSIARDMIDREILIAMSLRDILPTKMIWMHSYENYEEPIDGTQYFGISYIDRSGFLHGNWTIALAMHRLYRNTLHAGIEGEFFDMVTFRCGISNRVATLGAGVKYSRYSIDYAFTFDNLEYSYVRIGVGVEI